MEIIQIGAIGIISAILAVMLKKDNPTICMLISITAGVLIFLMVVPKLSAVIEMINKISDMVCIDSIYISTVIKIIGIAYIAQFSSQICIDAGEGSIANKIEFGGKVLIMILSAPILMGLIDLVIEMLP